MYLFCISCKKIVATIKVPTLVSLSFINGPEVQSISLTSTESAAGWETFNYIDTTLSSHFQAVEVDIKFRAECDSVVAITTESLRT